MDGAAFPPARGTVAHGDYCRWGITYGVGTGIACQDHGLTADQALDELAGLARQHKHTDLLDAMEQHRERIGRPRRTLHFMTLLLGMALYGNPTVAAGSVRAACRKAANEKRLERKQERQRVARDEHKRRQEELRIRETVAGLVTRVLAAPVDEARRVAEDAKKAAAARLAPTIALNKRFVRDKMLRVDRERRQRARVA